MMTFTFHTDAGHGWLEVPKALADSLGVTVSPFSYQKGDKLFLEEDLDACTFDRAAKAANLKFEIVHLDHKGDHPLRNYERVEDPNYVSPFMQ